MVDTRADDTRPAPGRDHAPRAAEGLRVVSAVSVLLIAYSHLVGLWPVRHGHSPDFVVLVRLWVNRPTGFGEDFGFLGTALLLLVLGHLVGPAPWSHWVRPLRRAAVAVTCAAAVAALLWLLGADPLLDVSVTAPVAAVGVYAVLAAAVRPLTRVSQALAILVLAEAACVLVLVGGWADQAGGPEVLRRLGPVAALLPLVVLGRLARAVRAGAVHTAAGGALGLLCVVLLVVSDLAVPDLAAYWHPLGGTLALLLFLIALPRGASLAATAPVRWLGDRALPLCLAVPVVGYPVAGVVAHLLPALVAVPIGLVCAGAAGAALHRGLEEVA
ncbi:hypothetical protein [Saccharothrix yanglingensis]|uniref:hypothetical protein n=1 Tax=Saccharothrix yanglingensis TaxID=659496 RepID=UPI0027D23F3A|nr:hypothetical protein [Saccharothrix yanglingensis]